jgi:hypothetical protein
MLTVSAPASAVEGQTVQVTVTVNNVHPEPIIPVTTRLAIRSPITTYFKEPSRIAERFYLEPVRAAEVRGLASLNRVEVVQIRMAGVWRRVPDTRYQHPARILLPGQSFTETFECPLNAAQHRRLHCYFRYLRLRTEDITNRLYARDKSADPMSSENRRIEVYSALKKTELMSIDPESRQYILHRLRPSDTQTRIVSQRVQIAVQAQTFSHSQAAAQARAGATGSTFLAGANCWVFDYEDEGTWFVGPAVTTKLKGRYLPIAQKLNAAKTTHLVLEAGRRKNDTLLDLFTKAGYVVSKPEDKTVIVHIPAAALPATLKDAEGLGYVIDGTTWLPTLPETPKAEPDTEPKSKPEPGGPPEEGTKE